MRFINAGSRNVVLRLSWMEVLEWWPEIIYNISSRRTCEEEETFKELLTCPLREGVENKTEEWLGGEEKNVLINSDILEWLKHGVVLRINHSNFKECDVCYSALRRFAGSRILVTVTPKLQKLLVEVVPTQMHHLINGVTDGVLMPDFACRRAFSLTDILESDKIIWSFCNNVYAKESNGVEWNRELHSDGLCEKKKHVDDTHIIVEIKPKAAFVLSFVEGIVINGKNFTIHPLKKMQCRYSLMSRYKSQSLSEEHSTLDQNYCPNMMFDSRLSTLEGLQKLAAKRMNNFILHCLEEKEIEEEEEERCEWEWGKLRSIENDCTKAKMQLPLKEIAHALDTSGVWNTLGELQVYGMANYTGDVIHASGYLKEVDTRLVFLPVLDIELLYRWSQAPDDSHIEWLVRLPVSICNANHSTHTNKLDWSTCMCSKHNSACNNKLLLDKERNTELKSVKPLLSFDEAVRRFYVATTAKDISIIVTLQLKRESNYLNSHCVQMCADKCDDAHYTSCECTHANAKNVDGVFVASSTYASRIGVIDLDDKHYKSLHHY